jgi:hypothetical protein
MKKLNIYFLALAMMGTIGCSDLLEEENRAGLTGETVYTSPAGFESWSMQHIRSPELGMAKKKAIISWKWAQIYGCLVWTTEEWT